MNHSRLAGTVAVGTLLAQAANAKTGYAGRDDDAARILNAGALGQQRGKLPHEVEDAAHVEVHDLSEGWVRMGVKLLTPCRARVGHQDVNMVGVRRYLRQQVLDALERATVRGNGDGHGAWPKVGKSVEDLYCIVAGGCLSGGDEDLRTAGLEKTSL